MAIVRDLYADMPTERLAELLGRSTSSTYNAAAKLGLHKSAQYMASPQACRLRQGDNVGAATRFHAGQTPWNKGMKGLQMGGVATQYKPGNRSGKAVELHKPIGTERISKDGYLQRKINDDMPLHRRWRGVHLLLWEESHGPIPPGHAVVFKNGNKADIRLDNLELVSRGALMKRNSYHNYGKDIAQLVQLKGAVTRVINRRESK